MHRAASPSGPGFSAPTVARVALLPLILLAFGCLEIPSFPRPDDGGPLDVRPPPGLAITSLVIESADGRRWPSTGIPRRPRIAVLFSTRPDPEVPLFLLAGAADSELAADLEASPLRESTRERAIDAELTSLGERVELTPRAPLRPGVVLTLAVGAWARSGARTLGAPHLEPLVVSADPALGAEATDAWPPDGASGVGPAVPRLGVRFDGLVELGPGVLSLHDETSGTLVPATVRGARCDEIGWTGPSCAVLLPLVPLARDAVHVLRLGRVLDATGAEVPLFAAHFKTSLEDDVLPPALASLECAPDEVAFEGGCTFADDRSISVRVRGSEPLRLALDTAEGRNRVVLSRGEGEIGLGGLGAATVLEAILSVTDVSELTLRIPLALETAEPLPELAIVEVRADPLGREPTQEYVELENRGRTAVDLGGFLLADALLAEGDVLPSLLVAPGSRVLVVSSEFDPDAAADVPVPPGVPLVRIDGSLGSGGLAAYGEPLFLRTALGQRISAAPALPARAGVCVVRVVSDPRSGAATAFEYDPAGTCTPGTE